MKEWLALSVIAVSLALAGCRSTEKAHTPPDAQSAAALRELGVADDRPSILLDAKTPDGRSEVVHHVIRKRLLRVQSLLQQGDPRVAERELQPLLQLAEARRYYARDLKLLTEQIARQKEGTLGIDESKMTALRAIREVEDRYHMPDSYGETHVISPDLPPLTLPPGRMEEVLNRRVGAIDLDGAGVAEILEALRGVMGLNFIADQALESDQQLNIHIRDVPLHELLSYISRNMGIAFHLGENVIWVTEALMPDDNGPQLETKIYTLRKGYIPAGSSAQGGFGSADSFSGGGSQPAPAGQGQDDLFNALSDFLEDNPYNPPNTKFQIYRNRNLLMIRNSRANLRLAEEIIREFDAIPKQVLIESRFITINQSDLFQLGVEIESIKFDDGQTVIEGQTGLPAFTQALANNQLQLSGILDNFSYSVILEALDRKGSTRTLSSPRITVLNNQSASIRRGTTLYYFRDFDVEETVTDNVITSRLVPSGEAEELELGISLGTTPSIGNDGRSILLSIAAEIAGPVAEFVTRNDVSLPEYPQSTLTTSVGVNSGQTVVLGGMITSEDLLIESKVPFLGDIPLIGYLFRKKERNANPEHLLIFVTATIVDQDGRFNQVVDGD